MDIEFRSIMEFPRGTLCTLLKEGYSFEPKFERDCYVPELVKALALLSHTDFLDNGGLDYYIVSKKYQWLIGFNHHDIISCIGEGLNLDCFQNQ